MKMFSVFKRKSIWICMLVAAILIGLFAFAQVGARSTVNVRHLPLALVVNDKGKDAKNVVKKLRKESHKKNSEIKWVNVKHTSELTKGFASGKYYGAVVIRSGFTKDINQQTDYLKGKIITQKLDALVVKTPMAAKTAQFQQQKVLADSLTKKTPKQAKVSLYVSQGSYELFSYTIHRLIVLKLLDIINLTESSNWQHLTLKQQSIFFEFCTGGLWSALNTQSMTITDLNANFVIKSLFQPNN